MRAVLLALGLLLATLAPATAQKASTSPLTYFYLDPQPGKVDGFLDAYAKHPADWIAYPPMVGFFAIVFQQFPNWAERLSPTTFDPKTAVTVAAAYKLSGLSPMPTALHERLVSAQPDPQLQAQFPNLPARLEDLRIRTPTDLDILWGAFSASGDERYVRKIIDFMANIADSSGEVAIDVTKLTVALNGSHSQEIFEEIRAKYDKNQLRLLANASTAQWALISNAHQHPKVGQIIAAYSSEHPNSPTTLSLASLLKKK